MKRACIMPFIIAASLACGCLYGKVHPLAVQPSAGYIGSAGYEVLGPAEGMSSGFTLFGLFPVTPQPDPERAVSEAVRSLGGDNMIDVVFYRETKGYVVGIVRIIRVEGKVIRYIRK